jgi:hypothetical protein
MLTLKQIRAQVSVIRRHSPKSAAIGLVSPTRWMGEDELEIDGERFHVRAADTELEMRSVVTEARRQNVSVVVLSGLDQNAIGEDLLARFARGKLFTVSATAILGELFQAREVDPRLQQHRWMATALADVRPAEGFSPVPQGTLDQETVWRAFFEHVLCLKTARPDLVALLDWSRDAKRVDAWWKRSDEGRTAVRVWTEQSAGPTAALVWAAVDAKTKESLIALGVVSDILFKKKEVPADVAVARGRLERYFGDHHISHEAGSQLAAAAMHWIELTAPSPDAVRSELEQADAVLRELRIEGRASESSVSPSGFEQRLAAFGRAVSAHLQKISNDTFAAIIEARDFVGRHRLARLEPERFGRIEMAVRLCRWIPLSSSTAVPAEFVALAKLHAHEGGFVDWARHSLFHGESQPELHQAYLELAAVVGQAQEARNHAFGRALVDWSASAESTDDLLLIEDVLLRRVAPLATQTRTVLVVLDGMSFAVYRQIIAAVVEDNWAEIVPETSGKTVPVIAGLPSVTEWSRRLLLAGRSSVSAGEDEAAAFRDAPALRGVTKPSAPPILYRKGELMETGSRGLSEAVRKEIVSATRQIIGIVINAVDDHLTKDDQLQIEWTPERIPLLQQVLDVARDAGRCVVLATDHGHVLSNRARLLRKGPSDRFRPNDGDVASEEVALTAGRAALYSPAGFIAPWSEQVYYTSRKNGYHGGVSAQELVVPVCVLAPAGSSPEGWEFVPQSTPNWWWDASAVVPAPAPVATKKTKKAAVPDVQTLPLFAASADNSGWIEKLLETPVYAEQSKKAGRTPPSVETVKKLLQALDERGGVLLKNALAQRTGEPEFRLNGLLAVLRRILNLDGYPILVVDDASGTVRLDRELLRTQFDV